MSARFIRFAVLLDDDQLADVATCVEQVVNGMRKRPDPNGGTVARRLLDLLEVLREARAESCATQLSQLADDDGASQLPSDLITTKEAAKLMGCSTSNIRARIARGSLWGMKHGDDWRLSQAECERTAG